jgi:S-layer protein
MLVSREFFTVVLIAPPNNVPRFAFPYDDFQMSEYTTELQKLYVAFFNRPADVEGLAYWDQARASGVSLESIARQFSTSSEYQPLIEGKTRPQLVDAIYHNLFGRAAEQGGLNYWVAQLDAGRLDAGNIALSILNGAQSADIAAIANKAAAAQTFTAALITPEQAGGYIGDAAISLARAWLSTVDGAATTLAAATAAMATALTAAVDAGLGKVSVVGTVVDGYVKGATVFADANGNFQLDDGEARGTTDDIGHFSLTRAKGALVTIGGIDTATGSAVNGHYFAPSGFRVISPLTTLVHTLATANNISATQAEAIVKSKLGIAAAVDLGNFDPIAETARSGAGTDARAIALTIAAAAAQVNILMGQVSALLRGAGVTADGFAGADAAGKALASLIAGADASVDLGHSSTVQRIIQLAALSVGAPASQDSAINTLAADAAGVIANLNIAIQVATAKNFVSSGKTALTEIAKIQVAAEAIETAVESGARSQNLTSAKVGSTGAALNTAIADAAFRVGDVDGDKASDATPIANDDAPIPPAPPATYLLTTGTDLLTGTAGENTIDGGTLDTFSASDSINGGDGVDTLNVRVSGTTIPVNAIIRNIETFNLTTTGAGYTLDTSGYTGLKTLNLVDSAQGAGAIVVDGGSAVGVTATGATTGTIDIGTTVAPTAGVTVSRTASIAGGEAAGMIAVRGGTTVSITQTATTTGALGTTATQGAVTVAGTAHTTAVTVNQTAPIATVATVAASTESAVVTWSVFNAGGPGFQSAGGVKVTGTDNAAHTAIEVATVAAGGTVAGLVRTTPATGWTVGPAVGAKTTFTSLTANANVADIVFTGSGYTYPPTASITQGVDAVTGVAGLAAGAVSITDVNAASLTDAGRITSVNLNNFGVATVNSSALSTITLSGGGTSFALTSGALTTPTVTTLTLNLNGVTTTGAVSLGAVPATVNIVSTGAASTLNSLSASSGTAVNISGDNALTISAHTLAATAAIVSTSTAAVTFRGPLLADQSYTGGSGVDAITLSASGTTAVSTGDGNDIVTYAGPIGETGSVDAGAGKADTIAMTASQAGTATASVAFADKVSNFEILSLSNIVTSSLTINMANADGINNLSVAGSTSSIRVTNAAADFTLTQRGSTSSSGNSIILADYSGTSDHVNLAYAAADGFTSTGTYTMSNVERLSFTTADADTAAQTALIVARISASSAGTVTLAGDMGISLIGGMTQSVLTSLDASGLTAAGAFGGLTFTTGTLAASSIIKGGAAGTNTVTFSAASIADTFVTYTGGSGADIIAGSNGRNNVVDLGAGTNSFTSAGGGNNTITGGAGADTITVGTGANTIGTGAGDDVIHIGAATGSNTVDVGTGTDTVVLDAIQTAAGNFVSVTGMSAGDIINLAAVVDGHAVSTQTAMEAKVMLDGTATFANYLDAAAAGDGATINTIIKWFQFNGNTYLVHDTNIAAAFQAGHDSVIQLVGVVDLSGSAMASGVITI